MVNVAMWGQALRIIPRVTHGEWEELDIISRWLIASRAAVFVMTFISAALAGLFCPAARAVFLVTVGPFDNGADHGACI